MRRLRVLHIITRLDAGGSATNTLETVRRLDPGRFEVDLIAGRTVDPDGGVRSFLERHRVRHCFLDELVRDIHPLADLRAWRALVARIRAGRYDIVHTHTSKAGVLGRWAARSAGVRRVVHTPHGHVFYGYFSRLLSGLFIMAERLTAPLTTRLVELTPEGVEEHLGLGIGRREQWTVVPSGIDLGVFCPSSENRTRVRGLWGVSDDQTVVLFLGRLERVKGPGVLLEAFRQSAGSGTRLVFVGDGRERPRLEAAALAAGLAEQVMFAGYRPDPWAWLNAADVVVMPSLNEGMGRTALEAMACGKPVIATRVGGLAGIVRDGQEGLLVPPDNVPALAAALTRLTADPALRQALGAAALGRVTDAYSIQAMVARLEALYLSLMPLSGGCPA